MENLKNEILSFNHANFNKVLLLKRALSVALEGLNNLKMYDRTKISDKTLVEINRVLSDKS